jgi:hypothetical protein
MHIRAMCEPSNVRSERALRRDSQSDVAAYAVPFTSVADRRAFLFGLDAVQNRGIGTALAIASIAKEAIALGQGHGLRILR